MTIFLVLEFFWGESKLCYLTIGQLLTSWPHPKLAIGHPLKKLVSLLILIYGQQLARPDDGDGDGDCDDDGDDAGDDGDGDDGGDEGKSFLSPLQFQ